jgi:4-methyl-5(b-hydroxyethyl)-thiazole monophosphate biosynthesis
MPVNVLVPIADGTEELEAVTIIDILRRAGANVIVAGVTGITITASRGVKLIADANINDCLDMVYDLIALPGGIPGAEKLRDCDALSDLLKKQAQTGKMIAAICAAPQVILIYHGILKEHRATGHPQFTNAIANKDAIEDRVVVDNNLITSRGAGSALEFSLKLVQMLFGQVKAKQVADAVVAAPNTI